MSGVLTHPVAASSGRNASLRCLEGILSQDAPRRSHWSLWLCKSCQKRRLSGRSCTATSTRAVALADAPEARESVGGL